MTRFSLYCCNVCLALIVAPVVRASGSGVKTMIGSRDIYRNDNIFTNRLEEWWRYWRRAKYWFNINTGSCELGWKENSLFKIGLVFVQSFALICVRITPFRMPLIAKSMYCLIIESSNESLTQLKCPLPELLRLGATLLHQQLLIDVTVRVAGLIRALPRRSVLQELGTEQTVTWKGRPSRTVTHSTATWKQMFLLGPPVSPNALISNVSRTNMYGISSSGNGDW